MIAGFVITEEKQRWGTTIQITARNDTAAFHKE
jgi:hypothetical protein